MGDSDDPSPAVFQTSTAGERPETVTTISTYKISKEGVAAPPISREVTHADAKDVEFQVGENGTLLLNPKGSASPGRKKPSIRKIVSFHPRMSIFDRENVSSASDSFRGFYTLFWILLFILAVRSFEPSYREFGHILPLRFAQLFSEDAKVLALSDFVLVTSTLLCVPFMWVIQRGWIKYYYTGFIIQHTLQTLYLFGAVRWTFFRQWPWVQSGFLTLHACSMLMKIHSYMAVNGEMSWKARQSTILRQALDVNIAKEGGLTEVRRQAKRAQSNGSAIADDVKAGDEAIATGAEIRAGARPDLLLRRRSSAREGHERRPAPMDLKLLMQHPSDAIGELATTIADYEDDLLSNGEKAVRWPANLTILNFIDYLIIPTLVYELEYPRTKEIRPLYILERTLATLGTFSLLYVIVENYILPITSRNDASFLSDVLDLTAPFMACYCLIFFIIFECILNGFAEIGRFADRFFYDDWWNSTSFDEFSRKWNRPVHTFLLRHVYASTMSSLGLNKLSAAFTTFFLSACMHELVMIVVTKKLRFFLFTMQMLQLPMVLLSRAKFFKKHPALGNLFFWLGLISGFPLLGVAYIRS